MPVQIENTNELYLPLFSTTVPEPKKEMPHVPLDVKIGVRIDA